MEYDPKKVLTFVLLIAGVIHVILFQNGFWNNLMWISAALSIIVPIFAYRKLTRSRKWKLQQAKKVPDI